MFYLNTDAKLSARINCMQLLFNAVSRTRTTDSGPDKLHFGPYNECARFIFGLGNGSTMATNVVLLLLLVGTCCYYQIFDVLKLLFRNRS